MTRDPCVWVIGLAALTAFCAAFYFSGLAARVRAAAATMHEAVTILADRTLDDGAKERLIRRGTLRLLRQSALSALAAAFVLAAPVAVAWIGHLIELAPFAAVLRFLSSWEVIVGATAAGAAIAWVAKRH